MRNGCSMFINPADEMVDSLRTHAYAEAGGIDRAAVHTAPFYARRDFNSLLPRSTTEYTTSGPATGDHSWVYLALLWPVDVPVHQVHRRGNSRIYKAVVTWVEIQVANIRELTLTLLD